MFTNGHCSDFLDETRSARYGAAIFKAQATTNDLIRQLIAVEHGVPFVEVEENVLGLLTHLLSELYGIVVARPVREILSERKEVIQ